MARLLFLLATALLLTSCRAIDCTQDLNYENFSITMSKGACLGTCPVYDGTVRGDRSIEYIGRLNTEREGNWKGMVDESDLCDLRTELDSKFVLSMKEDQMAEVMDAPATSLAITYKGQKRMIRWNMGTPEGLEKIVEIMKAITHENVELTPGSGPFE